MWYKILTDDEFINFFCDENNTFTITENGQKVLAPTFSRFADVVIGIMYAITLPNLPNSIIAHLKNKEPDIFRGYTFCRENLTISDEAYLAKIWNSIPSGQNESHYDVDPENLNAEQCAVLIIYPFCSRMGGSFEISFQEDGRLKKYLLALKKKIDNKAQN